MSANMRPSYFVISVSNNFVPFEGYQALSSLIMSAQLPLRHLCRLDPLPSQIIPHANQHLLPNSDHSSVDEPHRKEGDDSCSCESRHQHLRVQLRVTTYTRSEMRWEFVDLVPFSFPASTTICQHRTNELPRYGSPPTYTEINYSSALPNGHDGRRTCFGRPRIKAKQNFQKANPQTANTTVDICLLLAHYPLLETMGDLRWDNAQPHDESHRNTAFCNRCREAGVVEVLLC